MTENNHNYFKDSLPSHQALGDFAVPHVAELSLCEQANEPDIMKELGFDTILSRRINATGSGLHDAVLVVEELGFPWYNNYTLLHRKKPEDYSPFEKSVYNNLQVTHGLIQYGILAAGGDDHYARSIDGAELSTNMATYYNPKLSIKELTAFFELISQSLGAEEFELFPGHFKSISDRLVSNNEVREALDKLYKQPEHEKFRKISEEHDAKIKERAKAKPHGRFK